MTAAIVKEDLPHLYGYPWYQWAFEFFNSVDKFAFLCAANQISKSSTMIRQAINWATDKDLWPKLWPQRSKARTFWYYYPDSNVATVEFEEKWEKEFLPRGEMKDHPVYGWTAKYKYGNIHSLKFNSGVTIYFRTYEQKLTAIQTTTVWAIFADEEMPVKCYDETIQRISATKGYFRMVFTATLGQEFWRRTIEERGAKEKFKGAFKRQVSKYDCLTYMDGSASPWTIEEIKAEEASMSTEAERLKRIYGRFVVDRKKLFPTFERSKCTKETTYMRPNWLNYCGIFFGRGPDKREVGIALLRVDPEMKMAEVIGGWCGGADDTGGLDILLKYKLLTRDLEIVGTFCDSKAKDFIDLANRSGFAFQSVPVPEDRGDKLFNSLFKAGILKIVDIGATDKLLNQIQSCKRSDKDLIDYEYVGAMIVAAINLPWNLSEAVKDDGEPKDPYEHMDERLRWYKGIDRPELTGTDDYEAELSEANEDFGAIGYEEF